MPRIISESLSNKGIQVLASSPHNFHVLWQSMNYNANEIILEAQLFRRVFKNRNIFTLRNER